VVLDDLAAQLGIGDPSCVKKLQHRVLLFGSGQGRLRAGCRQSCLDDVTNPGR